MASVITRHSQGTLGNNVGVVWEKVASFLPFKDGMARTGRSMASPMIVVQCKF